MPEPQHSTMANITFVSGYTVKEVTKFLTELPVESAPDTIIVADIDKIVNASQENTMSDKTFTLYFAKLIAVLSDYSSFCTEHNTKISSLLTFTSFSVHQERILNSKLKFWFGEDWILSSQSIVCKSSLKDIKISFFLKDEEYFLDEISM